MKLFIILLAITAVFLLVSGGGQARSSGGAVSGSAANVTTPGQLPIVRDTVTFQVAMRQNTNVENYETNHYTKMIEEKCNVKLDFLIYPAANPGLEKLLIEIAGGGLLPELFINFGFSDEVIFNLGQEGIALPLNDYFEKWAYFFPRQLEKVTNKSIWQWMHSADGNIYYFPFVSEQIGEIFSIRAWMNQKWLDTLNLKMPETTAEFRTVLEAFRDRDPNGNGRRDEVPLIGCVAERGRVADFLINAFIYNDIRDRLLVTNGRVDVIYNKPEYREALIYVRDLMADGLLHEQLFTMSAAQ